jgi:hypothetical protein
MEHNGQFERKRKVRENSTNQENSVNPLDLPVVGDVARQVSHKHENLSFSVSRFLHQHVIHFEPFVITRYDNPPPQYQSYDCQHNADHMKNVKSFGLAENLNSLENSFERSVNSRNYAIEGI